MKNLVKPDERKEKPVKPDQPGQRKSKLDNENK